MLHIRVALVTVLGAALVFSAGASAAVPTLNATDGPGFTISVKKIGAKLRVTSVKAGKYKIVVRDLSRIHNFHLKGPGLDKKTGVAAKGTFTWIVTLKKGIYRYVCDPHVAIMKGSFKVS